MPGTKQLLAAVALSVVSLFAPIVGTARSDDAAAHLIYPNGVAIANDGVLVISDIGNHCLFRCDSEGHLSVIAGTGRAGFSGDGGPADGATLNAPMDVLVMKDGSIVIADTYNHRIRRITPSGRINTVAGNGKSAYEGDGGPAVEASLQLPQGIAVDSRGNLYIADSFNHVVRCVDTEGVITTFAGSEPGLAGDGGPATKAQLNMPLAVAVDADDRLYLCDASNSRIRRVSADGSIETVMGSGGGAGTGGAGFAGDGGAPARAKLFAPTAITFDGDGNWLIADSGNNRIRAVRKDVVTTLAGNGKPGFAGDDGPAIAAMLKAPQKVAVAKDGVVYFADRANHRVRRINTDGTITTLVGDRSPDVSVHVMSN